MATVQQRIIFGLKVRQFRQEKGWNFEELSRQTGISISYLNEIEKGKKYPMPDNQQKLANALGVHQEALSSPVLTKQYGPLGDLLQSNFLNELPLELFGIELQQVVEIIARAPDRVNAFISALLGIARNYSLRDENFFFAALRAYQELNMNYFEDIEVAAQEFVKKHHLGVDGPVRYTDLLHILTKVYYYGVEEDGLAKYPDLMGMRSVFVPRKRTLLLNPGLNDQQRAFQLAKELGFAVLGLKERPFASSAVRVGNFEEALNNFKAGYFAVAVLVNLNTFTEMLDRVFAQKKWNNDALLAMLDQFDVSPAVLFQRFNIISKGFDLHKVFFFRTVHRTASDKFEIDKELHLNRRHEPHASGLYEHYCRRWLSITLLKDLQNNANDTKMPNVTAGIQRATFANTGDEYLCVALAQRGQDAQGTNVSVMLGILLDDHARQRIAFVDDPDIPRTTVNVTCERCAIEDCALRTAPPTAIIRREERRRTQEALRKLVER
jgi:XRE family transcriptional regulator, fatty acid utilization regulator